MRVKITFSAIAFKRYAILFFEHIAKKIRWSYPNSIFLICSNVGNAPPATIRIGTSCIALQSLYYYTPKSLSPHCIRASDNTAGGLNNIMLCYTILQCVYYHLSAVRQRFIACLPLRVPTLYTQYTYEYFHATIFLQ